MFRRKGADLVIEKNLTLVESLCGFDFSITHMDKRILRVKSNPGQVSVNVCLGVCSCNRARMCVCCVCPSVLVPRAPPPSAGWDMIRMFGVDGPCCVSSV